MSCSDEWENCGVLEQPPSVLRANDAQTEQEYVEISVTRLLLKSYYDIVRKNIQDSVPKAIMHFLVLQLKFKITVYLLSYQFLYF